MKYKKIQMDEEKDQLLQFLTQYAQSKGINPEELIADFQQATSEQQQEFLAQLQKGEQEQMQYGGAHYNKNLNYILPNSILNRKNENVEEPVFKLKRKELQGDKRNGYAAYEQDGNIYMNNLNDEPLKQHETFHYLRSQGFYSPREQAIENELLDNSIYSPLDKNKLNKEIYSPEELGARFYSIKGYLPENYREEDFKKLWETGKDSQIQDLKKAIPYEKALYYMQNYHPPKMQMGGNVFDVSKASSKGKKTALEQANWLNNWYGTRDVVTTPIKIDTDIYNYQYYPNVESRPQKIKEEIKEIKDTYGFEPAAYNNRESTVFLNKVAGTTVPLHEFTHAIDGEYGSLETRNTPNIVKRGYQEIFGNDLKTDYRDLGIKPLKEDNYVTNPQESYARLNELRYTSGYKPNYKPTLKDIQKQRKLNKNNKLFEYYDDNAIMQMWNGLSYNDSFSPTIENPMLQQTAKFGIKNKIPRSEKGMYEFPEQPVVIPTRGTGAISMKGINYPVEAYNANTMEYLDLMQPNQEYRFDGVDDVLEIPAAKYGIRKMQIGGKTPIEVRRNPNNKQEILGDDGNTYVLENGKYYVIKDAKGNLTTKVEADIEPVWALSDSSLDEVVIRPEKTNSYVEASMQFDPFNPEQPLKPVYNVNFPSVNLPPEEIYSPTTINSVETSLKKLGKLDNKDYSSQYLSNAKLRNNRVVSPYFRRTDLSLPELYQEDVSPYLANITRQSRSAMQNINPNSTTGQAVAQQLASNAAFQSNVIQGQIANRNLERKTNWANTIAGIKSQQSQIDNANRAQYSDDWMRTLAAKDNVDNLIDLQAAQFKMNKQREDNQNVMNTAISSMINPNYDLQIDEEGNILYGVKQAQKFKNPYPAKFGLKRKAL